MIVSLLAALTISLPVLSVTASQAYMTRGTLAALFRQPALHAMLIRLFLVGLALTETVALIACGMVALLLRAPAGPFTGMIHTCAVLAIIIPALIQSWGMSRAGSALIQSLARQPDNPPEGMRLFIITQMMGQTPILFNTLCAAVLMYHAPTVLDELAMYQQCSMGLMAACGSLGTCIGLSRMAHAVGVSYGWRPGMYTHLFSLTLVSMALLETPFLLALGMGFALWAAPLQPVIGPVMCIIVPFMIGAVNMAVCTAASQVASTAARQCAQYPEQTINLVRWSMLAQTFIDTGALYGLMIALLMIVMV